MNEIKVGDLVRQYNGPAVGRYDIGVVTRISEKFGTCYVHWRAAGHPSGFYLPSMLVVVEGAEDIGANDETIVL